MSLKISIPMKPTTWQRPRALGKRYFTAKSHAAGKQLMQSYMRAQCDKPTAQPVLLNVSFVYVKPKREKKVYRAKRPDIDNLIKLVLDAGNGILWEDDVQVVSLIANKVYGVAERVGIEVMTLGTD